MDVPEEHGIAAAVRAAIAEEDSQSARHQLVEHMNALDDGAGEPAWAESLAALSALGEDWGYSTLRERAGSAHADDPADLLAVGHELVENAVLDLAEPVLRRAVALDGGPDAIAELAAALEIQGRYQAAVALLQETDAASNDPVCAFLLGFNALLLRDLELGRNQLQVLDRFTGEPATTMAANLRAMVERSQHLSGQLGDDLVAWHFVWTGGLLLDAEPRRGLGTWADSRHSLESLQRALSEMGSQTGPILAPPDRASQALSLALQAMQGVKGEEWYGEGGSGLLVVHDLTGLDPELRRALRTRPDDLLLYVHRAEGTREEAVAGDLTGSYGIGYRPPWAGGPGPDGDWAAPDSSGASGLADRIVGSEPGAEAQLSAPLQRIISEKLFRPGPPPGGTRSRQWVLPTPFSR